MALPISVVAVEEVWCRSEASRPARLLHFGWVVGPELIIGNNRNVKAIIPEMRSSPDQAFLTLDYFRIRTAPTVQVDLLQPGEARLTEAGVEVERSRNPQTCRMWITRRDANFEPDFEVEMLLTQANVINGRAWMLQLDLSRPRVAALFTTGIIPGPARRIRLGTVDLKIGRAHV